MEQSPTLLVMAAGMGSRYGGLKQLDPFGPHGETIIDYSVYDAWRAGFGKVVFVVRRELEQEFSEAFGRKLAGKMAVACAVQDLTHLPEGFRVPEGRVKPWGTAHAVWSAAGQIQGPFAVINGDDFYGPQSFQLMASFLRNLPAAALPCWGLVGFTLANTLSEHGHVARGICEVDRDGFLRQVTERTQISRTREGGIFFQEPDGEEGPLTGAEVVSMNMSGFTPALFPFIETQFKAFLRERGQELKAEFFLPQVVNRLIEAGQVQVQVLQTPEKWFGVTYPQDKPMVIQALQAEIQAGLYPENLWQEIPQTNPEPTTL
jgi:NDP-sugar pyrophosphorylase family protein